MLGKLARWLRMLGNDVEYNKSDEDTKLLELAKSEKRVLITRDTALHQQASKHGVKNVLVKSVNMVDNLTLLAKQFNFDLKIDMELSRCPKCNGMLEAVSKNYVIDEIAEGTSVCYDEFWKCNSCGQIYWQGAHWNQIQSTLERANRKLRQNDST